MGQTAYTLSTDQGTRPAYRKECLCLSASDERNVTSWEKSHAFPKSSVICVHNSTYGIKEGLGTNTVCEAAPKPKSSMTLKQ